MKSIHIVGSTAFAVLFGLSWFANTAANALQVDSQKPIRELAGMLQRIVPEWKIQHVDKQPSVELDGFRGYRLVVRRAWPHFDSSDPQQLAQVGEAIATSFINDDWEFVLIPSEPKKPPTGLKSKIQWQESKCPFHTREICLGEGHGYVWFTRGMIHFQHVVRDKLNLSGGDDPIEVLVDGLLVDDQGTMTANSVPYLLARYGDKAIPYIEKAIDRPKDPWKVITALTPIHTNRSTELLIRLFNSDDPKHRRPAMYALIHEPFREAAKEAYFDILREHRYVPRVSKACVQFGWQDALPILGQLIDKPLHIRGYYDAVHGRRQLEGNPVPKPIVDAEQTLRGLMRAGGDADREKAIATARQRLIDSDDNEAANLAALTLAIFITKGNSEPVRTAGIEILKARPRGSTIAFLKSLANKLEGSERTRVEAVLAVVNATNARQEKREQHTNVAWGESVNRLKAGLSFAESAIGAADGRVAVGSKLALQLTINNVSDGAVKFQTLASSFLVPQVHDSQGKPVMVAVPSYDGPAILQTHHLQAGQSVKLAMHSCSVAPRALIDDSNGCHIFAGLGNHKLSASVEVTPLVAAAPTTLLRTGTIQCEMIPPDQDTVTRRLAGELVKRADVFSCKVVYLGPAKPKLHSVGLMNAKFSEQYPDHWTTVKIDEPTAKLIIDFLAEEGLLFRYVADPDIPAELPQTCYFLGIEAGQDKPASMMIPLRWESMQGQITKLSEAVGGQTAQALAKILEQPLFTDWHQVTSGALVGVSVRRQLYERSDDPFFYVRLRLTNRTKNDVFVNLAGDKHLFAPNQWGFHRQTQRIIIDEGRMIPVPLTAEQKQELIAQAKAGKLSRIAGGDSLDFFRPFNRGGREDVQDQQKYGSFMIISIDGHLRATDAKITETINVEWDGNVSEVETDVVIPAPVTFQAMPKNALIIP